MPKKQVPFFLFGQNRDGEFDAPADRISTPYTFVFLVTFDIPLSLPTVSRAYRLLKEKHGRGHATRHLAKF